jgi:hypothetical protein
MTDLRTRTLRILLAGALGLGLVGGVATSAHALTPPAPQQQVDEIGVPEPDDPRPPVGPGDLTNGEDECHPLLASCDLAPNPGDGGGVDDGGAEVDDSVVATPTFTG